MYEEFDEVAKLSAHHRLSSFCVFVESVRNTFTTDLHKVFSKSFDKPLTPEKIGKLCIDVFFKTTKDDETITSSESKRYSYRQLCLI